MKSKTGYNIAELVASGIIRAIYIRPKWANLILQGKKTVEVRSTSTAITGRVAIIESGAKQIIGSVVITGTQDVGPDTPGHCIPPEDWDTVVKYKRPKGWKLADPETFAEPVPIAPPSGSVIWVNLEKLVNPMMVIGP